MTSKIFKKSMKPRPILRNSVIFRLINKVYSIITFFVVYTMQLSFICAVGLASSRRDGRHTVVRVRIERLAASFVGSGDLFTALITAWLHHSGDNLKTALEKTFGTMQVGCLTCYQCFGTRVAWSCHFWATP